MTSDYGDLLRFLTGEGMRNGVLVKWERPDLVICYWKVFNLKDEYKSKGVIGRIILRRVEGTVYS